MKAPARSLGFIVAGFLIPVIAARAAKKLAGVGLHAVTDHEPPKNPAHPDVGWHQALAWTAFSGFAGGVARLAARRWMASTRIPAEGFDMDEAIESLEKDSSGPIGG